MKSSEALKYINVLLNHAFDLLYLHDYGVNHAEHIFIEILYVVNKTPSIKSDILDQIEISLSDKYKFPQSPENRPEWFVPEEFMEFIAHALRWDELKQLAVKRKYRLYGNDTEFRSTDVSDIILAALNDDWEDKEMYHTFDNEKN